jgi:hypothetical protein
VSRESCGRGSNEPARPCRLYGRRVEQAPKNPAMGLHLQYHKRVKARLLSFGGDNATDLPSGIYPSSDFLSSPA